MLPTRSSRPSTPPGPVRPQVMNIEESFQAMQRKLPRSAFDFLAFYSSVLGGIVEDPALMTVPMDEHMVHRGHAVFDTCNVSQGQCYGLGFHLDRLLRSAGLARIHPSYTKEELRQIILSTVAASQQREGVFVRFWMTAGMLYDYRKEENEERICGADNVALYRYLTSSSSLRPLPSSPCPPTHNLRTWRLLSEFEGNYRQRILCHGA